MVTFIEAAQNKALRQEYLDGVDFEEFRMYPFELTYIPRPSVRAKMATYPELGKGNPKIIVYEDAFLLPPVSGMEVNFLSHLVDHEGRHVEQFFQYGSNDEICKRNDLLTQEFVRRNGIQRLIGMRRFGISPVSREIEMDAYRYQLDKATSGERVVTAKCLQHINSRYRFFEMLSDLDVPSAARIAGLELRLAR